MGDARSELAEWFENYWGEDLPAVGETDLFARYVIDGDDASYFIHDFIAHFGIDAQNYRWYFHHRDEGANFGGLFFAPPYKRVERLPITPDILTEAIETKRWPLDYPPHDLPTVRWDMRVNQAVLMIPFVMLALWLWKLIVR